MNPGARRMLQAALFVSGASSLVLEVAWSRALSLTLGNSHQAVATVVASMMAGLWAGSLLASRYLPRVRRPAAAYGLVEMVIGAYAALTPLILKALPLILGPLYEPGSPLFGGVRFTLVFVVLLPASAGMGATLPLAVAALTAAGHESGRGPRVEGARIDASASAGGRLYGLNTLGALAGVLVGGFVLLPRLGLLRTTLAAAGVSLGVGLLVLRLARGASRPEVPGPGRQEAAPAAAAPGGVPWILPLYALSGGLAMIYEIMWTRALAPIVGTSVYSFTLILGGVLAGIGLGSLLLSTRAGARLDPARGFVAGQIVLAVAAFLSAWALRFFPDLLAAVAGRYRGRPGPFLLSEFVILGTIVLPPSLILGSLFPLAARLVPRAGQEDGIAVGRAYAWNTAGSIAGALLAGFLLVETLGTARTLVLASAASALLAIGALPFVPDLRFRAVGGALAAGLALAFPFLVPTWNTYRMTGGITERLREFAASSLYGDAGPAPAPTARPRVVFHREGKSSTVTVVRDLSETALRVDGKTDASTTEEDMRTQVLLGQVPFLFARQARDACVIGLGSGVTSHAVLTHPVTRLDTIEIERQVAAASAYFEAVNFSPLADERSRLIVEDARTALLYGGRTYDVIISEPSNPWMAGVNNLFTAEFYRLVRRRLNPGGVFCQWVQFYEMSGETLESIFDSLASAFPHAHLLSSHMGADMLLLASDEPFAIVPEAAALFPDRPGVAPDLARVGMQDLADLALLYTTPIPAAAPGSLLNTDDNSLLQYRMPLEMLRGTRPQLLGLQSAPEEAIRLFFPGGNEPEVLRALGRAAYRREAEQTLTAIGGFMEYKGYGAEAREMRDLLDDLLRRLQDRPKVDVLIAAAEKQAAASDTPGAVATAAEAESIGVETSEQLSRFGFLWLQVGRPAEAEKSFGRAFALPGAQTRYESLAGRGAARLGLGRRREGLADLDEARKLDPDRPLAYALAGRALAAAGEKEAALAEIRSGLASTPESAMLRSLLERLESGPAVAQDGPLPQPRPGWE